MTKSLVASLVSMGAIALGLAACDGNVAHATAGASPPSVSTAHPVVAQAVEWDEYTGHTEAMASVEIRARVGGYLERVAFAEGALVKKGDLLYAIDARPYEAEVARAEADLARANAEAAFAKRETARAEILVKDRAIAERDYDVERSKFDQLAASSQVASAALATARLNLGYSRLYAPISGRIGRTSVTPGNLVAAGAPVPLTTLVSVDPLYVYVDVDEARALRTARPSAARGAEPRTPASVGLTGEEGYPRQGYLDFVENHADPGSGTVQIRVVLDNADGHLTPGLFSRVRIPSSAAHDALLISDSAVGTDQDRKFVYVIGDGEKVEYRRVVLGPLHEGLRIVHDGLKPSDRVVVNGLQRVRPGAVVAAHDVPANAPEAASRKGAP